MDTNTCRTQLAQLLQDETAMLQRLEQQLHAEHGMLKANDVDGLEKAGAARHDTVSRLLRLDDERRQLCVARGQSHDQAGLLEVLRWCDPAGSLSEAYRLCTTQAQRCRDQNSRNGALVAARLSRIDHLLRQIHPGDPSAAVYGPRRTAGGAARVAGRILSANA